MYGSGSQPHIQPSQNYKTKGGRLVWRPPFCYACTFSDSPAQCAIRCCATRLNSAITRPTPITATTVPTPTPVNRPANAMLIPIVIVMLHRSKQFFVKPTLLPTVSAMACTIPSPGLGTSRISSEAAAPTPVSTIARHRNRNRPGKLPRNEPA